MPEPFLSLYTPTYRRPTQLARCLDSVRTQTIADRLEQIVIPDHVGLGVGGMFTQVQKYASAVHGQYVHFLADDDVLAAPDVCERLERLALAAGNPPLILVRSLKGSLWPSSDAWPPVCGHIDLGCFVTRRDVWQAHCHAYGNRYEGDFDFITALYQAGVPAIFSDLHFCTGGVSHGRPEEFQAVPV